MFPWEREILCEVRAKRHGAFLLDPLSTGRAAGAQLAAVGEAWPSGGFSSSWVVASATAQCAPAHAFSSCREPARPASLEPVVPEGRG